MNKKSLLGSVMLLIAAMLFGCGYAAQKGANAALGPFTVNSIRFIVGGLLLIPVYFVINATKKDKVQLSKDEKRVKFKKSVIGGLFCGLSLTLASGLQQAGLTLTTAGNSGFIVSLYIIFVPIIGLFFKKKVGINLWIAIVIAIGGLFLISFSLPFKLNIGDLISLFAAIGFAINIIFIGKFSKGADAIIVSIFQCFTTGILSIALRFIFGESAPLSEFVRVIPLLCYSAIGICCIAYTLQVLGQKCTSPTLTSVILSLESIFAFVGGIIFLNETVTLQKIFGAILLLCAVMLAQFNPFELFKRKNKEVNTEETPTEKI